MKNIVKKSAFLKGAFLLTSAGLITRFMGFFYRVFLANVIGAHGMGIYQLIFPVYAICFSLCASGIETAVSRFTASKYVTGSKNDTLYLLFTGLLITGFLSLSCTIILRHNAIYIAKNILGEPACAPLLRVLACTIPFGTLQSCICGYYFGLKKAGVPAFAQLFEQISRIAGVYILYKIYLTTQPASAVTEYLSPMPAVLGMVFGEFVSLIFTLTCLSSSFQNLSAKVWISSMADDFLSIIKMGVPLSLSRILINILTAMEAVFIPAALRKYGMQADMALSIYGIITGMVLPFILFPNALTSSISVMLLPTVSQSQAKGHQDKISLIILQTGSFCLSLGFACLIFFFLFGEWIGMRVFSNASAGTFLKILSFMCPFLYLNTTLNSILNGLGQTVITFRNSVIGIMLRIILLLIFVPVIGIKGYLYALLASQLLMCILALFSLRPYLPCFPSKNVI